MSTTVSGRRAPSPVDERLWAAVGWPGFPPQSRVIPPLVVAGVGGMTNRAEALWQLAAWGVVPVGELIKKSSNRPRPPSAWLRFGRRKPSGSSFPSTHVAMYTAFYGFAAVVLLERAGPTRLLALMPLGLVALVGPSRLREGDHWASDVVGGYLLGAIYIAALLGARRALIKRRAVDWQVAGGEQSRSGREDANAEAVLLAHGTARHRQDPCNAKRFPRFAANGS